VRLPDVDVPDVRSLWTAIDEHEILNSASAIAFQTLFAAVPLALFTVALAGFLQLDEVWSSAARELRPQMSQPAFEVVDDSVRSILERRQLFWLTAGAALAIWRLSAAMRATMHALDLIYGGDGGRPLTRELRISIGLSLAITVLLLTALTIVLVGRYAVEPDGALLTTLFFTVQWLLVLVLILLTVGLTIRFAPSTPQPIGWVSFGSALAAVAWIAASVGFGVYLTRIADYGSVFGSFATIFILLTYLYLSAAALLIGVEADAQVRRNAEGSAHGG
jgi:membrane protein